jgi:hypothetical protein
MSEIFCFAEQGGQQLFCCVLLDASLLVTTLGLVFMIGPLLNGQLLTLSQRLVCLEVGYYCFANPDVSLLLRCLNQLGQCRKNTSLCPFVRRKIPHFEIVTIFMVFMYAKPINCICLKLS